MAIVLKWCDTENQYMAEFDAETEADIAKKVKSGEYTVESDGTVWELKDEHKTDATYETKEMTPKKKTATRKKAEK